MKKILAFLLSFLLVWVVFAGTTEDYHVKEYSPVYNWDFNFETEYHNGDVYMKWSAYPYENFKYYKIIRSSKNSNPAYPEDGAIKVETDQEMTKYTDWSPNLGVNYYRICAITSWDDDNEYQYNRYCSEVRKIYHKKVTPISACPVYALDPSCAKTEYKTDANGCGIPYCVEHKDPNDCSDDEYAPVCGVMKKSECNSTGLCTMREVLKTYNNKCELRNDENAYYKYTGKCKDSEVYCPHYDIDCGDREIGWKIGSNGCKIPYCTNTKAPTVCTMEYAPVCGYVIPKCTPGEVCEDGVPHYRTFSNKCTLKAANAIYKYTGKCKNDDDRPDDVNVCPDYSLQQLNCADGEVEWYRDDRGCKKPKCSNNGELQPYHGISANLKAKADKTIESFIKKLERKGMRDDQIIQTIDKVIAKLNKLHQKYHAKNSRLEMLIEYMMMILEKKKEQYEDDFSDIDDIFKEFE